MYILDPETPFVFAGDSVFGNGSALVLDGRIRAYVHSFPTIVMTDNEGSLVFHLVFNTTSGDLIFSSQWMVSASELLTCEKRNS